MRNVISKDVNRFLVRLLGLGLLVCPALTSKELTVCEVLASLPRIRGKQIAVRGVWTAGDHGAILQPLQSSGCARKLRSKSMLWPDSLALVQQTEVDMRSLAEFEVLLKRSQLKEGDMVVVTLIGVLDARWPPGSSVLSRRIFATLWFRASKQVACATAVHADQKH